jgi:4-diphosphocytidyl-2-C-methyl-D-erythritol kinase
LNELTLLSPAKINLALRILRKRSDGYHEIQTIVQQVSLYDEITLQIFHGNSIAITADDSKIPADSSNLAYRAAQLVLDHTKRSTGVSIHIKKRIPAGAGLGGGSSNAAATLKGMNTLLACNLSNKDLQKLGITLGADVPFFLCGYTAACAEGIGEILQHFSVKMPLWFVIIFPGFSVSTAWAYGHYNILTNQPKYNKFQNSIKDLQCVKSLLTNDLEQVVVPQYPEIKKLKESLITAGACGSLMSGSGSSVFGVFQNEEQARQALASISLTGEQKAFVVQGL